MSPPLVSVYNWAGQHIGDVTQLQLQLTGDAYDIGMLNEDTIMVADGPTYGGVNALHVYKIQ